MIPNQGTAAVDGEVWEMKIRLSTAKVKYEYFFYDASLSWFSMQITLKLCLTTVSEGKPVDFKGRTTCLHFCLL